MYVYAYVPMYDDFSVDKYNDDASMRIKMFKSRIAGRRKRGFWKRIAKT